MKMGILRAKSAPDAQIEGFHFSKIDMDCHGSGGQIKAMG